MELGRPVTKLDVRNRKTSKKYDDAMSANGNVVARIGSRIPDA